MIGQDERLDPFHPVRDFHKPAVRVQKAARLELFGLEPAPLTGQMADPGPGGFHQVDERVLGGPVCNPGKPHRQRRCVRRYIRLVGPGQNGTADRLPDEFRDLRIGIADRGGQAVRRHKRGGRFCIQAGIGDHRGQKIQRRRPVRRVVGIKRFGPKITQRGFGEKARQDRGHRDQGHGPIRRGKPCDIGQIPVVIGPAVEGVIAADVGGVRWENTQLGPAFIDEIPGICDLPISVIEHFQGGRQRRSGVIRIGHLRPLILHKVFGVQDDRVEPGTAKAKAVIIPDRIDPGDRPIRRGRQTGGKVARKPERAIHRKAPAPGIGKLGQPVGHGCFGGFRHMVDQAVAIDKGLDVLLRLRGQRQAEHQRQQKLRHRTHPWAGRCPKDRR